MSEQGDESLDALADDSIAELPDASGIEASGTSTADKIIEFFNVWKKLVNWAKSWIAFFHQRPDLLFLLLSFLTIGGTIGWLWAMEIYDHLYGYMGPISSHIRAVHQLGYKGIRQLRDPNNTVPPAQIYRTIQDAAKLSDAQIAHVKVAMAARKAHDIAFELQPFYNDPLDDILQIQLQIQGIIILLLLLIIFVPFILGYLLWFIIKYWVKLIPAAAGFILEVCIKFFMDWIVAEVKQVFADVISVVVRIFTFGKKKKTVTVNMPVFSDYWGKWWKKYIQPLTDDMQKEYQCKIYARTKSIRDAMSKLAMPYRQTMAWFQKLKLRGLTMPYDEFQQLVLKRYPGFVASRPNLDAAQIKKLFYDKLKSQTKQPTTPALPATVSEPKASDKAVAAPFDPSELEDAPADATSAVVRESSCPVIL